LLLVAEPVVPAIEILPVVKVSYSGLIKVFFRYQALTGRAVKVTGGKRGEPGIPAPTEKDRANRGIFHLINPFYLK